MSPDFAAEGRVLGVPVAEPEGQESDRGRWNLNLLLNSMIVVQICAVIAFGSITILRYPLWSVVDEGAHFDNIAYIAEHHSLPVLGKAHATEQELAIGKGVYPGRVKIDAAKDGLAGLDYEAFQPPLYYLVATPFFYLNGNFHSKAIILRFLGLAFLLLAIALFARLSRHVLKKRWRIGLAGGLLVFLMPGIIVRSVTISNDSLAIPIAIATVTELWIALERRSSGRLIAAGALVSCGVLTDLYLAEMVPVFIGVAAVILWSSRTWRDVVRVALAAGVGVVVALPWFVFNAVEYHALTASAVAKAEQLSTVNPHHLHFTVGQLPALTVDSLFQPLMPQEWGSLTFPHPLTNYVSVLFQVLLVPLAIFLTVVLGGRLFRTGYWVLVAPWVVNVLLCWYIDIGQQWESGAMVARYTYATLTILGLFVVAATLSLVRSVKPVVVTMVLSTAFLVVLWIQVVPSIASTPHA
jgi:D-alanyl-D-alanine carboxypeptidase (penicillin-binding protein 5/6)